MAKTKGGYSMQGGIIWSSWPTSSGPRKKGGQVTNPPQDRITRMQTFVCSREKGPAPTEVINRTAGSSIAGLRPGSRLIARGGAPQFDARTINLVAAPKLMRGAWLTWTLVKGEMVEKELDTTIERRCLRKDPDEERELWKASVARHNALRREELRMAWCEYHL